MGDRIEIRIDGDAGTMPAYQAEPSTAPKGAIIVLQEIFGINPGIRAKADHWASLGYLAIAPDLFWRLQPDVQLDPDIPEQLQTAFGLYQKFDVDLALRDIEASIRAVRADGRKVGAVGYCLGGLLAYLTATRTDIDASVGYYGGGIHMKLNEAHGIAKPLMLHFAGDDHFIDQDARTAIGAALDTNPHVTIFDYPGVDHGFAATSGSRRVDAAAKTADARTEEFFKAQLG